jgi:hypothetical protein
MNYVKMETGRDCFRACVASLLELALDKVPDFYAGQTPGSAVSDAANDYIRSWFGDRGLYLLEFIFEGLEDDGAADNVIAAVSFHHPGLPFILCGTSRKGVNHAVIVQDGDIIHDPAPAMQQIHGPMRDGYYRVNLIGLHVGTSSWLGRIYSAWLNSTDITKRRGGKRTTSA